MKENYKDINSPENKSRKSKGKWDKEGNKEQDTSGRDKKTDSKWDKRDKKENKGQGAIGGDKKTDDKWDKKNKKENKGQGAISRGKETDGKWDKKNKKENKWQGAIGGDKKTEYKRIATKSNEKMLDVNKFRFSNKRTNGCQHSDRCGGCSYLETEYLVTLKNKQKVVDKLLKEFCKVDKIIGMEEPVHYRNKVNAAFSRLRNGKIISGIYEAKSHRVINVDNCMIEDEEADKIIFDIRNMLKSFKIKTYDEDTQYGLLRHVMIRCAKSTGEYMVVLILSSPIIPSKNNFVKAIRELHPNISTVIINVNDKSTSMVLGEKQQVIYGKGFITDILCGLKFRISPKSFYQINKVQTEVLYNKAIEFAGLSGKESVIDAYCGIGTIGMVASKKLQTGQVIGVELNKDAIKDAIQNAKLNNIDNIKFICADAGKFMINMADNQEKVDVVFMDPPRAGSDEAFLSSMVKLSPSKVVYISCNPETLARDAKYLWENGYRMEKAQPVDMFAWTEHVETIVALHRTSS